MAKPRRVNGPKNETRHLVKAVATVLIRGEPTLFRFEAYCRHRLRWKMCLQGMSWARSDATAADIVRRALELLNVKRPPWAWGQREYAQDSVGTRVSFTHCLHCGARLPENRPKFCGGGCGDRYRQAFQSEEFRSGERERALASLQARRDRAAAIPCEACGAWFRPANAKQRFCSRQCSGGRSVKEKMNGKRHPWVNGNGKIGGNGANAVAPSSPTTPTPENGSAIADARAERIRPTVDASEPRPAPS
jgi:predicted nucleic acid-binding Zn ribbon protein